MTRDHALSCDGILLDFDGTLADTIPLIVASYRHALGGNDAGSADTSGSPGVGVPDETTIRRWIGRALRETLEEVRPGEGDALVQRYREHNLAHHDDLIEPVPGAGELVEALQAAGRSVAVVSSKRAELVRRGMRLTGVPEVEVVVGLEETSRHKPDPGPLLEGARRLGLDPSRCVYVGDAVVDVQAARAAGMGAVAVTWGAGSVDDLEAAGPDALARDADDLRRLLLG